MSRAYAAKLHDEHSSVAFDHELIAALRGKDLNPEVESVWSVGSINPGEENSAYLLAVVSHLTDPLNEVDVATAERKETLVCGCPGYYFHAFDQDLGAKVSDCKHCLEVQRARRVEIDKCQVTL